MDFFDSTMLLIVMVVVLSVLVMWQMVKIETLECKELGGVRTRVGCLDPALFKK